MSPAGADQPSVISSVLDDTALAERIKYTALGRACAFTWRGPAEQVGSFTPIFK